MQHRCVSPLISTFKVPRLFKSRSINTNRGHRWLWLKLAALFSFTYLLFQSPLKFVCSTKSHVAKVRETQFCGNDVLDIRRKGIHILHVNVPQMSSSLPDPSPVPEWVGRLLSEVNATVASMSSSFMCIPGSKVAVRYIRSSYQNDPIRSFIELCLVFFVVRYLTKPSYSVEKNQLKLTERVMTSKELC